MKTAFFVKYLDKYPFVREFLQQNEENLKTWWQSKGVGMDALFKPYTNLVSAYYPFDEPVHLLSICILQDKLEHTEFIFKRLETDPDAMRRVLTWENYQPMLFAYAVSTSDKNQRIKNRLISRFKKYTDETCDHKKLFSFAKKALLAHDNPKLCYRYLAMARMNSPISWYTGNDKFARELFHNNKSREDDFYRRHLRPFFVTVIETLDKRLSSGIELHKDDSFFYSNTITYLLKKQETDLLLLLERKFNNANFKNIVFQTTKLKLNKFLKGKGVIDSLLQPSALQKYTPPMHTVIDEWSVDKIAGLNPDSVVRIAHKLTHAQVAALPEAIKKVQLSSSIHSETIENLAKRNFEFTFKDFNFVIGHKYLGGLPYTLKQFETKAHKKPWFRPFSFANYHSEANGPLPEYISWSVRKEEINLTFLSRSKRPPNKEDKFAFVFASRKEKALIPEAKNIRVVLVVTKEEAQTLNLQKTPYEALVIERMRKPYKQSDEDISTISARRLATLLFAFRFKLSRILMLDDNISSIRCYDKKQAINFDSIYQSLVSLQQKEQVPFVFIPSHNPNKNGYHPDNLGSKCHLWDLDFVRHRFPGDDNYLKAISLMPDDMHQWGEDFFTQILLHRIATLSGEQGFKAHPEMELVRSKKMINLTQSRGMKAAPLSFSDDYQVYLLEQSKELFNEIKASVLMFNSLVRQRIASYKEYVQYLQNLDIESEHAKRNNLEKTPLPLILSSPITFYYNLATKIEEICLNARDKTTTIQLFKHQLQALEFLSTALASDKSPTNLLFNMATGSGKTLVQSIIALTALSTGNKSVVLVTPYRHLAKQTYQAMLNYIDALPWLNDCINLSKSRILKIFSGDYSALPQGAIDDKLKKERFILITCRDSYAELMQNPEFLENIGCVINDESHLIPEPKTTAEEDKQPLPLTLHFTATPKLKRQIDNTFIYSRIQGVRDEILTPLLVDTLPDSFFDNPEKYLISVLNKHCHPSNKAPLLASKGIIFCASQKQVTALQQQFKRACPDIPSYQIISNNSAAKQELATFKMAPKAIAFSVNMMIEGFDDKKIAWSIIIDKKLKKSRVEQIAGRILRRDIETPEKIGLLLGPQPITQWVSNIFNQNFQFAYDAYQSVSELRLSPPTIHGVSERMASSSPFSFFNTRASADPEARSATVVPFGSILEPEWDMNWDLFDTPMEEEAAIEGDTAMQDDTFEPYDACQLGKRGAPEEEEEYDPSKRLRIN